MPNLTKTRLPRLMEWLSKWANPQDRRSAMETVLSWTGERFCEAFGRDEFANFLLDASHKAVVDGYDNPDLIWPKIVRTGPAADFKTHNEIAGGAFGNLDAVKEFDEYPLQSLADEKATLTVAKYGKRFAVSLEARVNDDLGQLQDTVQKMSAAAARTIENYVLVTNLQGNPTIYDATALFTTGHANNGGTAGGYTRAKLITAISGMIKQTGRNGEKIGITPSILVVNPDKYLTALEDVSSAAKIMLDSAAAANVLVGGGNLIGNFIKAVLSSPYLTTDSFYVFAAPARYEGFRLRFLRGQQTPEILREAANAGFSFSHDAEQFKIRHVFGGAWTDFRSVYRDGV